jgi:hypothetical protein
MQRRGHDDYFPYDDAPIPTKRVRPAEPRPTRGPYGASSGTARAAATRTYQGIWRAPAGMTGGAAPMAAPMPWSGPAAGRPLEAAPPSSAFAGWVGESAAWAEVEAILRAEVGRHPGVTREYI